MDLGANKRKSGNKKSNWERKEDLDMTRKSSNISLMMDRKRKENILLFFDENDP